MKLSSAQAPDQRPPTLLRFRAAISAEWAHPYHLKLFNAGINIYACNGVVDGTGRFGYVLWVDPAAFAEASKALKASDWRTIQPSRRT